MVVGRPSRDEMFMQLAHVVSQRSTCQRAHVGAIITNWDGTSIKSMGYNGNARGLPDGCDNTTPGLCGCLHAEENALLKAPYGPELTMYTTVSPCLACAKRILNSSVRRIVYDEAYRDDAGLRQLCEPRVGLVVEQVSGMSWWQGQLHEYRQEITKAKSVSVMLSAAVKCLMKERYPSWRPGLAVNHSFTETVMQFMQDATVRVNVAAPGPSRGQLLQIEVR